MRLVEIAIVLPLILVSMTVSADDWGECATLVDNELAGLNCDFNDGVTHWAFSSAMGLWNTDVGNGFPSPPCGEAQANDPGDYSFTVTSECITASPTTDYAIGLYSRTPGGATISCAARIEEYSTTDCSGVATTSPDAVFVPELNLWTSSAVSWTTLPSTLSARGVVECSADASFTVLFDNIAVVQGTVVPVELQQLHLQ